MKTFKSIFIALFPVMIFACIITHFTRHITIRETVNYFVESYNLNVGDLTTTLNDTKSKFESMTWELPSQESIKDLGVLERIGAYVSWFANVLVNVFTSVYLIVKSLLDLVVFILKCLLTFIRVLLYFFGLNL